jgi:hypothetical protein
MYKVLEEQLNDWHVLEITEGEFKGYKFTLGEIAFAEQPNDDGTYTLSFEYNMLPDYNGKDTAAFRQTVGTIVESLLEAAVARAEVVYKGGI